MSNDRKTCAQLVHQNLKSRMEDLHVIWSAYCAGERGYDDVKRLYEQRAALLEKYPKKPRKGTDAREDYDDAMSSIEAEVDRLDGNAEFLYQHFEQAEQLGGYEAYHDYGLSIDYVEWDVEAKYGDFIRWQLSWGGPSDEFQFYCTADGRLRYVEYRYMDWFDGASAPVCGEDEQIMAEIFDNMCDCGIIGNLLRQHRCEA